MASQIEWVDQALTNLRPERIRAACFRAALTELCRIEDLSRGCIDPPLNFAASDDPSLHLVKLLRNYQVHFQSLPTTLGAIDVRYLGETARLRSYIVAEPTLDQLRKLDSAKPYRDEQLLELIALLADAQRRFGITQLLYHLSQRVEAHALEKLHFKRPRKAPRSF